MIRVEVTGLPEGIDVAFNGYAYPKTTEEFDRLLEVAGKPEKLSYDRRALRIPVGDAFLQIAAPTDLLEKTEAPSETPQTRFIAERLADAKAEAQS
jgi:hypothetical protein